MLRTIAQTIVILGLTQAVKLQDCGCGCDSNNHHDGRVLSRSSASDGSTSASFPPDLTEVQEHLEQELEGPIETLLEAANGDIADLDPAIVQGMIDQVVDEVAEGVAESGSVEEYLENGTPVEEETQEANSFINNLHSQE